MSKTADEIGLVAAGVALAVATYGAGSSFLVSTLPYAWASASTASSLFAVGVSVGLSGSFGLLQSILNPNDTSVPGSQQNYQNSAAYRRVIYGAMETGGVITYDSAPAGNADFQNQGPKANFRHQIYTVAGHQISSFGRNGIPCVVIDGILTQLQLDPAGSGYYIPVDFNMPYAGKTPVGDDGGYHIFFEFDLGDPASTSAFPQLSAACPDWVAGQCIQRGRAKVHVAMRYDYDADGSQIDNNGLATSVPIYVNGIVPTFRFPLVGKPIVDTRMPGGGGYGIATNPSNPALVIYDWLTNTEYGEAADPATIDIDSVNAAANLCEEEAVVYIAANGGSVSEQLYTCNGVFDQSTPRGDTLKALVACCAGTLVPPGDLWHLFAGAYSPPTTHLTDADLRGAIKGDFRISRRDLCNGVKGLFLPSFLPTNTTEAQPAAWRFTDFPPYQGNGLQGHPNWLAEDGGQIIWKEAKFALTTSIWTAQRLAKIILQTLRFQVTLHLACKATAFQIQAGDTITFTHKRWAGLAEPPPTVFFVTQATLVVENGGDAPAFGMDLVLRETDPSIYQFAAPTLYQAPGAAWVEGDGEYSQYGSLGVI